MGIHTWSSARPPVCPKDWLGLFRKAENRPPLHRPRLIRCQLLWTEPSGTRGLEVPGSAPTQKAVQIHLTGHTSDPAFQRNWLDFGGVYFLQYVQPNNGPKTPLSVPGGITFASITASNFMTCGLTADGSAFCWSGAGASPVPVPGDHRFSSLSTGNGTELRGGTKPGPGACGESANVVGALGSQERTTRWHTAQLTRILSVMSDVARLNKAVEASYAIGTPPGPATRSSLSGPGAEKDRVTRRTCATGQGDVRPEQPAKPGRPRRACGDHRSRREGTQVPLESTKLITPKVAEIRASKTGGTVHPSIPEEQHGHHHHVQGQ